MKMVRCKIYLDIEGKEKLLVPKLDSFIKHFGVKTCSKVRPGVILRQYIFCPSNVHVKNEKLHASKGCDIVVVQFSNGDKT
jgi:hypothetical protein